MCDYRISWRCVIIIGEVGIFHEGLRINGQRTLGIELDGDSVHDGCL